MTEQIFTENELYELFLAVDDRARQLTTPSATLLLLRRRLLPWYKARHSSVGEELHK